MEQTDVGLAIYRTSFEFCCVCLKTRAESLLQQTNVDDFLTAIQVQQVSPWVCIWCLTKVRSFNRLKDKAQRSQCWLYNVGQETIVLPENAPLAIELRQIKSEPYTVQTHQYEVRTHSELSSEIKVEPKTVLSEDRRSVRSCRKRSRRLFHIDSDEPGDSPLKDERNHSPSEIDIKLDPLIESDCTESQAVAEISPEQILAEPKRRGRPRKMSIQPDVLIKCRKKKFESAAPVKKERKKTSRSYAVGYTMSESERRADYEERLTRQQYVEALFKCERCGLGWHHREAYVKHMRSHSPMSGGFRCPICDSYFPRRSALDSHTWNHYRRFRCALCGYSGSSGSVSTHYFAAHSTDEFACEQCGRSFRRPKHLELHMQRVHRDRKAHRCSLCSKVLWSESALKYHVWSHNAKRNVWFRCDVCLKRFQLKGNLKNHMRVHAPERDRAEPPGVPVACSGCFKQFDSYDKLERHIRRCHTVKKYQCDHCKKCFFSKSELKRHIYDVHLKIMDYACPSCAKKCPSKYSLRRHILRAHETVRVKDKLCDLCGKGFWTRQLLEKHRYTHTGERPHACHHCGAGFAQRSTMTTHIKLKHLRMKRTASGAFMKKESSAVS